MLPFVRSQTRGLSSPIIAAHRLGVPLEASYGSIVLRTRRDDESLPAISIAVSPSINESLSAGPGTEARIASVERGSSWGLSAGVGPVVPSDRVSS